MVHALAIQTRRRRDAAFRYPSATQVIETLNGGSPANPADLQALVFEHLLALRDDISRGPTDGYKAFWNVGPHGSLLSPRPEDECRDRLLDRLRDRLAPLGLAAEPEGHYAMDKRSDIKVLHRNTLNLPIEIKRHYHRNVWTAPQEQLKKLYAQDPGAGGRGIYLVIWFGTTGSRRVPRPPSASLRPADQQSWKRHCRSACPGATGI